MKLQIYVDIDLAGDIYSWKRTTNFAYILGSVAISWGSNLQKTIALSVAKVEYVVDVSEVSKEIIWL